MSSPPTAATCQQSFVDFREATQVYACRFFELIGQLPSSDALRIGIPDMSDAELETTAQSFSCFVMSFYMFQGLCPTVLPSQEDTLYASTKTSLQLLQDELEARNMEPVPDEPSLSGWETFGIVMVLLFVLGVCGVFAWLFYHRDKSKEPLSWDGSPGSSDPVLVVD